MERQTNETKRPGELDILTNVSFLYGEMMELLVRQIDTLMEARGRTLRQDFKHNHRRLMEAFRRVRYLASLQGQFCDRLSADEWDGLHRQANDLLRINLAVVDRGGDSPALWHSIEKAIRDLPSKGNIKDSTIDLFTLK